MSALREVELAAWRGRALLDLPVSVSDVKFISPDKMITVDDIAWRWLTAG